MSETIDILMDLLNEYRESGCAIDESRVSWYARRLDGRTMNERTKTEQNGVGSSKVRAGSSITDELRKWVHEAENDGVIFVDPNSPRSDIPELLGIADRIDAEHERMYEDLTSGMEPMTEDNMARDGWVKMPVDADGVPIHVGDEMDVGIVFAIGDEGVFMVENGFSGKYDVECFDGFACHHRKPDSWERIIGDALTVGWTNDSWSEVASAEIHDRLVERCRRLADGI